MVHISVTEIEMPTKEDVTVSTLKTQIKRLVVLNLKLMRNWKELQLSLQSLQLVVKVVMRNLLSAITEPSDLGFMPSSIPFRFFFKQGSGAWKGKVWNGRRKAGDPLILLMVTELGQEWFKELLGDLLGLLTGSRRKRSISFRASSLGFWSFRRQRLSTRAGSGSTLWSSSRAWVTRFQLDGWPGCQNETQARVQSWGLPYCGGPPHPLIQVSGGLC